MVIPVTGDAAALVAEERSRWERTAPVATELPVVYVAEAPDLRLLRARLEVAVERIPPFPLRLGPVVAPEGRPHRGLHHAVTDPVGAWTWLRDFLLAPPFRPLDVVPHVPVVDGGLSGARRARRALDALSATDPDLEFRVAELVLRGDDDAAAAETFPLVAFGPTDAPR